MAKEPTQIFQIRVSLDDTHPPIWRRILVPSNTSLLKLHDILQIVMGWKNSHLHMYTIDDSIFGDPADDEYGDMGTLDEAKTTLSQAVSGESQHFAYEYDFGDSWHHTLLVEKILPPEAGVHYPLCLKGKRACPPEDVGGVGGYEYYPEALDIEEINAQLSQMGRGRSAEARNAWYMEEAELVENRIDLESSWSQILPESQWADTENLPLRRDMIALLSYLRDNKVTGTQATGNLPLKAVHAICAQFVNPPKLEDAVGAHIYRVRSETEVWPLYFLHLLASVGGLVTGGPGRRWRLSPLGERFLAASAPLQVWLLFATWWTQINWGIAAPYAFEDGYMPDGFSRLTLKHLLDLSVTDQTSFEPFADQMIEDAELVWSIPDQDIGRGILFGIIERIVIQPLVDFGILQAEYKPHAMLGEGFHQIITFWITPLGSGLLQAMKEAMGRDQL